MREEGLVSAYRLLGISEDADLTTLEEAYRERRLLYSEDTLATYALFTEEERAEQLERLQAAYKMVVEAMELRAEKKAPDHSDQEVEVEVEEIEIEAEISQEARITEGTEDLDADDESTQAHKEDPTSQVQLVTINGKPDNDNLESNEETPLESLQPSESFTNPVDQQKQMGASSPDSSSLDKTESKRRHPKPPPFDGEEEPGDYLKRCREEMGLSISDLAKETRVGAHYLIALEEQSFKELIAEVYVRGFGTTYAQALRASPVEDIVKALIAAFRSSR